MSEELSQEERDYQADMAWLRRQRLATEDIAKWIRRGFITTVLSGMLFLLWEGLKLALHK